MAIRSIAEVDLPNLLPLFDVSQSAEYQYWKSDAGASWQLRCIGGPGSGKTTLSWLIIEDLRTSFKGPRTATISIFLQSLPTHAGNGNSYPLSTQLLLEIQRQLESNAHVSDIEGEEDDNKSNGAQRHHEIGEEALYGWIRDQIKLLDRAFLVIDDLDLAFQDIAQYRELESQLSRLQDLGFKILTTSRVPYLTGELRGCDVATHSGPAQIRFWWHCETCGSGAYDICHECKSAGNGCNNADHAGLSLVHEPSKVQFYISHFFLPEGLSVLVRDAIQQEHGDLGLDTTATEQQTPGGRLLPPLSPLGQELAAPANRVAGVAERLVEETATRSDDVVAIALLRLNHLWKAKTLKEARAVPDRLPRELLHVFDAGVAEIASQRPGSLQRFLGLQAIRIVGRYVEQIETHYDELKEELRAVWEGNDEPELSDVLDSEDGLEQVLFAARGFLTSRKAGGTVWVKCYQVDFHLYVAENYSDILSSLPGS
ncbi:hypothetical protein PG984_008462 [Apiospora sp. TS-2023a]